MPSHFWTDLADFWYGDSLWNELQGDITKIEKLKVYTVCTSKMCTTLKAHILVFFGQNLIKLGQGGPLDIMDSKNGQNLVCTVCTSKMCNTLKAHISVIFGQNLIKPGHCGPLDIMDSKSGQNFGIWSIYQQKGHHFWGPYLSHFWSELNKTWTGWSIVYQEIKMSIKYEFCFYITSTTFFAPWR